ncbi:MAG: aldehyde dehydrogenase, partial [Rhodobacteraceae bacterium]|nr:aldehyde dehydrogenase [Paracoccaceae bacterium]
MADDIRTVNPVDESSIETYARMTPDAAFAAIEDCHDAFDQWRLTPPEERAEVIRAIARELRANTEAFAQLLPLYLIHISDPT